MFSRMAHSGESGEGVAVVRRGNRQSWRRPIALSGRFPRSFHCPIDAEFKFWGQAQSRQDSESGSSWPG
jgi:hypothetical protein